LRCDGAVYTAGGDATIRGYDARSGTLRHEFVGHEYCVNVIKVPCSATPSHLPVNQSVNEQQTNSVKVRVVDWIRRKEDL